MHLKVSTPRLAVARVFPVRRWRGELTALLLLKLMPLSSCPAHKVQITASDRNFSNTSGRRGCGLRPESVSWKSRRPCCNLFGKVLSARGLRPKKLFVVRQSSAEPALSHATTATSRGKFSAAQRSALLDMLISLAALLSRPITRDRETLQVHLRSCLELCQEALQPSDALRI